MTERASPAPGEANAPFAESDHRAFAHASEAEFARILDFYQVDWRYEPHPFPILWSLDGEVLESFAPDFYLPELDLFVEMTTLRQKLVRKKNRKLRRLRELYPDIRIKLFYARDFRALMLKYGRVALADALSGAEGQFTPAHPGPAAEARTEAGDETGAATGTPTVDAPATERATGPTREPRKSPEELPPVATSSAVRSAIARARRRAKGRPAGARGGDHPARDAGDAAREPADPAGIAADASGGARDEGADR